MSQTDTIFTADELDELGLTIEHINAGHTDTVLLVARFRADCRDAHAADITAIDAFGVSFRVESGQGTTTTRLWFDEPATSVTAAREALRRAIVDARDVAGDSVPETSMEHEIRVNPTLRTYLSAVEAVTSLTPNLFEVTLRGGLDEFRSLGGDQFAYLMVPSETMVDGLPAGFSMSDLGTLPPDEQPLGAYYTIRRWDAESRTITLWAVRHGHESGVAGWLERCRPGDQAALWGPRVSLSIGEPAGDYLFVADESGFAAVAALVEQVGASGRVSVIAETVDVAHAMALASSGIDSMTWCFRGTDEPGTTGRLLDAVVEASFDPSTTTVFAAGESREVTAIRKHLRHGLRMPPDRVFCTGYWRRSAT